MYPNYAIVILSYNHPDLTEKTVNSVIGLTFPLNQIYLVHNGSFEKNITSLSNKFRQINHIIIRNNKGFSGGANHGLKNAFEKYENILFLTNDTELIKIPQNFPKNSDILSPLILKRNSNFSDSVMGSIHLKLGKLKHLKHISEVSQLSKYEKQYAPGTAFGLSKKCFFQLDGFDESFHTYWEDVDFSLRAQALGFLISHTDEIVLRHKIGKTCHKDRFYTLYLYQRNRRKLAIKHHFISLTFLTNYTFDMIRLLVRLLFKPHFKAHFNLWRQALNDAS